LQTVVQVDTGRYSQCIEASKRLRWDINKDVASPGPTLPAGHPFTNIQSSSAKGYWSATTMAANSALAWHVFFDNGLVTGNGKLVSDFVWCVRGPMNADAY
jgi:hypothetical protein